MSSASGQRTQLVIFDLGGTTLQDDGAILRTFLEVAEHHGLMADADYVESQQGKTKRELFHALAVHKHADEPDAAEYLANKANGLYEERLTKHYSEAELALMLGTVDAFQYLREHSIKVAITTGFWRTVLDVILDRTGLSALVDTSVATDEVSRGKPAPYMIFRAMEQCDVARGRRVASGGDPPLDCIAGCNAGCGTVIGVLSGTHTRASLEKVHHNHIIDSAARVIELFESGRMP